MTVGETFSCETLSLRRLEAGFPLSVDPDSVYGFRPSPFKEGKQAPSSKGLIKVYLVPKIPDLDVFE